MTRSARSQEITRRLHTARERTERGQATRADWLRVSELDPDVARDELDQSLRLTLSTADFARDPFAPARLTFGAGVGFALGLAIMLAIWLIAPPLRDRVVGQPVLPNVLTALQFGSTAIPIALAWIGARRRDPAEKGDRRDNASLDELLDRLDAVQGRHRARVY